MFTEIIVSEEQAEYIATSSNNFDQGGWIICPPPIADDDTILPMEKMLIGRIYGLMTKHGYCYASNQWLSERLGVSKKWVSSVISGLCNKGVIRVELVRNQEGEVIQRRIYPVLFSVGGIPLQKEGYPTAEGGVSFSSGRGIPLEREYSIKNNKKNKDIVSPHKRPTLEEISAYCKERNSSVSAEHFFDYYESVGWRVGNKPMKSWQAAVRTWERRTPAPASQTTVARF